MKTRLMCDLLALAASNPEGELELPVEAGADPAVSKALGFLVEQGWIAEDGAAGTWTVTAVGRFWFESLDFGDILKFYEYGGAVFLLHTRPSHRETIVWHKGRFATIGIAYGPHPERFEVRKENEPVTTSGGSHMADALAVTTSARPVRSKDVIRRPSRSSVSGPITMS